MTKTNRTMLAALKRAGIYFQAATSAGGGNRDHRYWYVEFSGPGLPRGFVSIHVADCGGSGQWDGKAYCRRLAVEKAVQEVASQAGIEIVDNKTTT